MDSHRQEKSRFLWLALSIAMGAFVFRLDSTIVNISLPVMARYFQVGTSLVSWVMLAYYLSIAATLLIFGKLGDLVGVRRLFFWGYCVFVGSSLLCGISPHIYLLIGARCLQGLGGSMLIIGAFALIPKLIPRSIEGWAFGILATASSLGVTAGAPLGGLITSLFSWHWVFLINLPLGILAILAASRAVPKLAPAPKSDELSHFDLGGAVASSLGLLALLYALNMGQELGWRSPLILSCFATFALLMVVFAFREGSTPRPLLDLKLLANRSFSFDSLATFGAFGLMAGSNFLVPFYLELVCRLNTFQSGLVMMVYAITFALVSLRAGALSDRIKPSLLCTLAMISATAACLVYSFTLAWPGLWPTIIYLAWLGASLGFFMSPNNSQIMQLAPKEERGSASGVMNTIGNTGQVLGVCLLETVFSQSSSAGRAVHLHSLLGQEAGLLAGFRNAFWVGALLCAAALAFSWLGGRTQPGSESALAEESGPGVAMASEV